MNSRCLPESRVAAAATRAEEILRRAACGEMSKVEAIVAVQVIRQVLPDIADDPAAGDSQPALPPGAAAGGVSLRRLPARHQRAMGQLPQAGRPLLRPRAAARALVVRAAGNGPPARRRGHRARRRRMGGACARCACWLRARLRTRRRSSRSSHFDARMSGKRSTVDRCLFSYIPNLGEWQIIRHLPDFRRPPTRRRTPDHTPRRSQTPLEHPACVDSSRCAVARTCNMAHDRTISSSRSTSALADQCCRVKLTLPDRQSSSVRTTRNPLSRQYRNEGAK